MMKAVLRFKYININYLSTHGKTNFEVFYLIQTKIFSAIGMNYSFTGDFLNTIIVRFGLQRVFKRLLLCFSSNSSANSSSTGGRI
jgi:hypothetical protein